VRERARLRDLLALDKKKEKQKKKPEKQKKQGSTGLSS